MATYNSFVNATNGWALDIGAGGQGDATLTTSSSTQLVYTSSDGTKSVVTGTGLVIDQNGLHWTSLTSVTHVSADGATTYESITGISGAGAAQSINTLLLTILAGNDTFNMGVNTHNFADFGGSNTFYLGPAANHVSTSGAGTNLFVVGAGDWVATASQTTSTSIAGTGASTLQLAGVGNIDISHNGISGVQTLQFLSGTNTATLTSSQITSIIGSSAVDTLNFVSGGNLQDYATLLFQNWTSGQDVINFNLQFNFGTFNTTNQDDTIVIGPAAQGNLNTEAGNDTLIFNANSGTNFSLIGSSGNDVIQLNGATVDFAGASGANATGTGYKTINYNTGTSTMSVSEGSIAAGAFSVINGSANVDTFKVVGHAPNLSTLTFNNWSANDVIMITDVTGAGTTTMTGSSKNDTFILGGIVATVDGGAGTNSVDYSSNFFNAAGLAITVGNSTLSIGKPLGTDFLFNIQKIVATGNTDTVSYSSFTNSGLTAIIQGGTGTTTTSAGTLNLVSVENLIGTANNDSFYLDKNETVDGGNGVNTLYELSNSATITLNSAQYQHIQVVSLYTGVSGGIINAAASTEFDTFYGAASGNTTITTGAFGGWLIAEGGISILNGGANAAHGDIFVGTHGTAIMNGGLGTNYYYVGTSDTVHGNANAALNYEIALDANMHINLNADNATVAVLTGGGTASADATGSAKFVTLYSGGVAGNYTLTTGSGGGYMIALGGTVIENGGAALNQSDIFVGGNGANVTMTGGLGLNYYYVDANDTVHGGGQVNHVVALNSSMTLTINANFSNIQEIDLIGGTNTVNLGFQQGSIYVFGAAGDDTIIAGSTSTSPGAGGNEIFIGRGGANTFKFSNGWGSDAISDWAAGTGNHIDLTALAAQNVHGIADLTISSANGNTYIQHGADTITLTSYTSGLTAASFVFA